MSPDLKARRLLMAAHLYYDRASPVISDSEYDKLSIEIADEIETGELLGESSIDEVRLIQLGEADSVRAGGNHFQMTQATIGGAEAWHREATGRDVKGVYTFEGEEDLLCGVLMARMGG